MESKQMEIYPQPVPEAAARARTAARSILPTGRANAMPRADLAAFMGTSDREARRVVEELRRDGAIIVNAQDGRGYYIPDDEDTDAVLAQIRQDEARAKSILVRTKHLRQWLRERGVEA